MFNLERKIAEWRRQMLAAGISTPAHLDELESHLREGILEQLRSGTDVREAFAAATGQLGDAGALNQEFKKPPGDVRRFSPACFYVNCFLFAPLFMSTGWSGLASPGAEGRSAGQLAGSLAIVLISIYMLGLLVGYRWLFGRHMWLMRAVMRIGNWYLWILPLLSLATLLGLVRITSGLCPVVGAALIAFYTTTLAAAKYKHEHLAARGNS